MVDCRKCGKPILSHAYYVNGAAYHETCEKINVHHKDESTQVKPNAIKNNIQGIIKWFLYDKGYGYILVKGKGDDLFFHISEYRSEEPIEIGDKVSFKIGIGRNNRPAAKNVSFIARAKKHQHDKPYYGKPTYDGFFAEIFDIETTETCMKCGGTGHVTAVDDDYIGFQCEKCYAFWKSRNKDRLSP